VNSEVESGTGQEPGAGSAPRRARRKALVNMNDVRPAWALPGWARTAIASAFPTDWEVIFTDGAIDGRGDGSGASAEAIAAASGIEAYFGLGAPREILLAATSPPEPTLRWMHTGTAGVASLLYPELVESDVVLTNSAGVHAPAIAETVLAMMLHFARGLDFAAHAQARREWDTRPFAERADVIGELDGGTVGILGFGGIGREVARRAQALGMNVVATRRSGRPAPEGVDVLIGPDAIARVLAVADYVVISLPSTPTTRGLLGPDQIKGMKRGAVLTNVARGDIVDEDALATALRAGVLRGAGLDVFREEPLPSASPLWDLPNVLITPHVSATTPRFWVREVELIRDNIARYAAGRALRNVVDKERGY
jgi:phosphoglycerate dehydrogenase-like enzyme